MKKLQTDSINLLSGVRHVLLIFLILLGTYGVANCQIPKPENYFGHKPGADYKMLRWDEILSYFTVLDSLSPRVKVEHLGKTTLGNPFILAIISSPDNLAKLDEYKAISRKLAQGKISGEEAKRLSREGKTIALITCSMHATECGPTQMSPELAYELVLADTPEKKRILEDVILLLVPSWNPDGNIMVTDWYRQNVGTDFETSPMPWLYHHYVGHDNNRDAFMHTQIETRYVNDILYHDWYPQLFMDMHHMGNSDARLFLSPLYEPRHHSIDPLITREIELTGAYMRTVLEEQGKTGVMHYANWNHWRMSAIHTSALWHNVTTILFEAAKTNLATPIFQDSTDLTGKDSGGLGKQGNNQTINYPSPWNGGWWRLRDIVEYSYWSSIGFLEAASLHREKYLFNIYKMAKNSIEKGKTESPYAFVIPPHQKDPNRVSEMINILISNGVEIHQATEAFTVINEAYPKGTFIILTSQAYRPFIIDILGPQLYPDRREYPGGPPERTFDITGWTLPYQMGVEVNLLKHHFDVDLIPISKSTPPPGKIVGKGNKYLIDHDVLNSYKAINKLLNEGHQIGWAKKPFFSGGKEYPSGTIVATGRRIEDLMLTISDEYHLQIDVGDPKVELINLQPLKLGLYKPWKANMDEGWTRWIFDNWNFPYTNLHNADIKSGDLISNFDVIIIPNIPPETILNGHSKGSVPEKYAGGIEESGTRALQEFVKAGGTLITLNASCQFAIDSFELPFKNISKEYPSTEFFCPSSILRIELDTKHPLAYGLTENVDILSFNSPFFDFLPEVERNNGSDYISVNEINVIGRYPDYDPFRSGRLIGGEILRNKPVLIESNYGDGKIILFAFRPQNRAQTQGTFMLFFNSLYYGPAVTH